MAQPQLPPSANAIRVARIALLAYAFCVPTVMGLFAYVPGESTLLLPSPRKLLVIALLAYQVHALLTTLSPPARVLIRQDVGGMLKTIVVVMIGMPLMHAVHGETLGWFVARTPVVWLFDSAVPFSEFALLSPRDALLAPAEVMLGTLVDLAVIFLLGGTGYDTVIDGQKRRVTHGWLRFKTSFDDIVGLARERVDVRSASGRQAVSLDRAVILRRSRSPIPLPLGEPSDDRYLDALAAATGLPRGGAPARAPREVEQPPLGFAEPLPHIHDPEDDAMPQADVLLATPGFSVSVSADAAALVVTTRGQAGAFERPIPTAGLVEMRLRGDADLEARHSIPTGFEPAAESRWIELAFVRGLPWLLGPLPGAYAEQLALEFRRWRSRHPVDLTPVTVDADALFADPTRWHTRRIDVVARWHYAFEHSSVGSAWLKAPEHAPFSYGTYRARIVGTWIYPVADAQDGYGHLGCWPGVLHAEAIEVLEILDQPQVSRDGLTGLPKRTALGLALDQAVRAQQPVALAMLDIDRFKQVNDAHGHEAGDDVLRRCATALVESLRPGDVVVRWGGDEFAAVMPGMTIDAARELLESVHARVRTLGVTVSMGLVAVEPGDTSAAVFERADGAVYEAKRRGRNCTVVVDGAR